MRFDIHWLTNQSDNNKVLAEEANLFKGLFFYYSRELVHGLLEREETPPS